MQRLYSILLTRAWPWALAFLAWFLWLWYLSSLPRPLEDFQIRLSDKLVHILFFAGGGISFFCALRIGMPRLGVKKTSVITVLAIAAVGILDEYHQSLVPGRSGNDWGDMLADAVGGGLGVLLAWFVFGLLLRLRRV